jgi:mycofactocin biosynthesis protein MftB
MSFDLDRAWRLDGQVALRPEPFGALAYHFGNRRLTFLKTRKLFDVVESLESKPTGRAACSEAGVSEAELPAYAAALGRLAEAGMIVVRGCSVRSEEQPVSRGSA